MFEVTTQLQCTQWNMRFLEFEVARWFDLPIASGAEDHKSKLRLAILSFSKLTSEFRFDIYHELYCEGKYR